VTAIVKAASDAEFVPSVTEMVMLGKLVPPADEGGMPEMAPVDELKVAQEGRPVTEKVSAASPPDAVGVKE
jgi:hypothetical protein